MNTKTMKAFKGDKKFKSDLLKEVERHRKMDQIAHCGYSNGMSGEKFAGCAVGCSINSLNRLKGLKLEPSSHTDLANQLDIPVVLARLQDGIFEGLPQAESLKWPGQFYKAIPVGADLTTVWPKFALWLLVDKTHGVIRHAKTERTKKSIQDVADLYSEWIAGNKPSTEAWMSARRAAYAAADAAADAADAADAAYAAAYADADAAYATYADAAADAAYAAVDADARRETRIAQSKKLIQLMKDCK